MYISKISLCFPYVAEGISLPGFPVFFTITRALTFRGALAIRSFGQCYSGLSLTVSLTPYITLKTSIHVPTVFVE